MSALRNGCEGMQEVLVLPPPALPWEPQAKTVAPLWSSARLGASGRLPLAVDQARRTTQEVTADVLQRLLVLQVEKRGHVALHGHHRLVPARFSPMSKCRMLRKNGSPHASCSVR